MQPRRGRWWQTSALWCYTDHTSRPFPAHSCTSTWRRRAHPWAEWGPSPSTETATRWPPPLSGCRRSAPCRTASETEAWCGSAPVGWSPSRTPLKQTGLAVRLKGSVFKPQCLPWARCQTPTSSYMYLNGGPGVLLCCPTFLECPPWPSEGTTDHGWF